MKWRIAAIIITLTIIISGGAFYPKLARSVGVGPGISTPTSFVVTLEKAEIQQNLGGKFGTLVTQQPATIDVVANTGKSTAMFGSGDVAQNTYNGVRLTLSADATYSGVDPCTGSTTTDSITLPGATNGQYVLDYEVPHPIRGLPAGAVNFQAFTISADQQKSPMEFRIVFPVSNSIACVADTPPITEVSGADTGIRTSYGMYLDRANSEVAITNFDPNDSSINSINFYQITDTGNVLPTRVIQGSNTLLNQPWGIALDSTGDKIFVTNSNDDKILAFNRSDSGDTAPIQTISNPSGCIDTCLDGTGGIAIVPVGTVTTTRGMVVTNGGPSNSISFYHLTDNGQVDPQWTIKGPDTGLSTPCGIAYDGINDEIFVGNNGNDSITVYDDPGDGFSTVPTVLDTPPKRIIQGNHTNLSKLCNVVVDPLDTSTTPNQGHDEIAVANSGTGAVTFYNRGDSGNVFPIRTMSGGNSGITLPVGLAYDTQNGYDSLGLTDISTHSLTIHTRADSNSSNPYGAVATPLKVPVLFAPTIQQNLYSSYYFTGSVDRTTGAVMPNPGNDVVGNSSPLNTAAAYDGYGISWKIYDKSLRQPADAINAALIPPSSVNFLLANGASASNLQLGCAAFTPFIIDVLTTYCKTQPMIVTPSPPVNNTYRVGAELLAKTIVQKLPLNIPPLEISDSNPAISQWPRLVPTVDLSGNGSILDINWIYQDKEGNLLDSSAGNAPILYNQAITINGNQGFGSISSCYKQVGGNAPTLLYSSPSLEPDVRTITDVKNNSCDLYLSDVATITFTVSDAFGNKYVYTWTPS